jgi:hypothetical protein
VLCACVAALHQQECDLSHVCVTYGEVTSLQAAASLPDKPVDKVHHCRAMLGVRQAWQDDGRM